MKEDTLFVGGRRGERGGGGGGIVGVMLKVDIAEDGLAGGVSSARASKRSEGKEDG